MSMILNEQIVRRVEDKVLETYLQAQKLFGRQFDLPAVEWTLKGRCAGRAFCIENRIKFNPILLQQNVEDFILQTVPHEIAHLINHALHGRFVKPHGREWKKIMTTLGLEPLRCHNYATQPVIIRRPQRRHVYYCACRTHWVTQIIHNRMRKGASYSCQRCGAFLTRNGPAKVRSNQCPTPGVLR
jgi:SprT protein